MSTFQFHPTTLLAVLKSEFYSVPKYQRSYSWRQQQVEDFWNDIDKAISENSQYFLGTLVFSSEQTAETTGADVMSVIDGQQRLATTTILLAAIRRVYTNAGEAELAASYSGVLAPLDPEDQTKKPRIRLNAEDHPFYEAVVLNGQLRDPELDSHRRISDALAFLGAQLEKVKLKNPDTWQDKLSLVWRFLNKQARVVTVTAANEADAFTIFETLNDRGADLTIADLLKNYLFSQAGPRLASVQNRWISANVFLRDYQEEKEFLVFLRHLWSSIRGSTRERDLYRDIKSGVKGSQEALGFAEQIDKGAKLYGALLSSDNDFWSTYSKTYKSALNTLMDLKLQQGRPTLLAILDKFPKAEIEKSINLFVTIYVRGIIAGGIGGGQAERYLSEAASDIRSSKITDVVGLSAKLKNIVPSDSDFERAFGGFTTGDNRFARYLLLALERSMTGLVEPELVPNDDAEQVNLEHILPKNATATDWPAFTQDERGSYPYRLGNMTLLSKKENGRIGNRGWAVKKPVLTASSLAINKVVSGLTDWRTGEIESRQAALAKQALLVWKL